MPNCLPNDEEKKAELQQHLNLAAPGLSRVDRVAHGYVVVTVMPLGTPEVFSCMENLHYQYVTVVGAPAHLFKEA